MLKKINVKPTFATFKIFGIRTQDRTTDILMGNRIVFHIFSPEGDIADIRTFASGGNAVDVQEIFDSVGDDQIIFGMTDGFVDIDLELATVLDSAVNFEFGLAEIGAAGGDIASFSQG